MELKRIKEIWCDFPTFCFTLLKILFLVATIMVVASLLKL